ncbi:MAG: hypothetical protein RL375_1038 [Pseudomonadota bacterium]
MPHPAPHAADAALPTDSVQHCDVLIIGGGPAGATLANLLGRQGRDVVMLEKAHHPRFHIGESLLPANGALFDELGIRDEVDRIGMAKLGVEFVSPDHDHCSYVEFADAWDKSMPKAWQVRRSEFDEILFRHARLQGARCFEGARARRVAFDVDGADVEVDHDDGRVERWRTRYVVDATGRDTLLANQFKCKRKHPKHSSAALYGHFTGARRLEGTREGNITILWFRHGWFWFIPLADGATSIGAVCWPYYLKSRDKPLLDFFHDTIALCPALHQRLAGATLIDDQVHATGNYAYTADHCTGERYVMLGDAYAFIDPVFSSGVLLAMKSAFAAVDLVDATLDAPARAPAARRAYERILQHGPREFSWFIFRVTNPTMREFFMSPANPLRVKEALLSMLAGDIYGKTPIWRSLRALKALYYLVSMMNLGRTWRAWQARRVNIRDVEALNS